MRYPIKISRSWQGLFSLFGFRPGDSYVEIDGQSLRLHFGTAEEVVPLDEIAKVEPRRWPFYFGLGPKIGPGGGVSYVGSTEGMVQIDFVNPRPMNVWGAFRVSRARCAVVSLEDAERFIADMKKRADRG